MMQSYICIDLETTGLNPKTDKIIEIGAVKVTDGKCTDTFSTFVNPGRKLDERIVELTGIRDEDLREAPYIETVLPKLLDFMGELPLLGHSILFDFSFLKRAAVNQKLTFEREAVDTLRIARRYLTELEHRSLDYLCEYYGIPHRAHRALADAEATVLLYEKLTELFYLKEEGLFEPKRLNYAVKKDNPATKAQKIKLYRLLEQHNITLDVDVERLTRSEVSRYTDKILSGAIKPEAAGQDTAPADGEE